MRTRSDPGISFNGNFGASSPVQHQQGTANLRPTATASSDPLVTEMHKKGANSFRAKLQNRAERFISKMTGLTGSNAYHQQPTGNFYQQQNGSGFASSFNSPGNGSPVAAQYSHPAFHPQNNNTYPYTAPPLQRPVYAAPQGNTNQFSPAQNGMYSRPLVMAPQATPAYAATGQMPLHQHNTGPLYAAPRPQQHAYIQSAQGPIHQFPPASNGMYSRPQVMAPQSAPVPANFGQMPHQHHHTPASSYTAPSWMPPRPAPVQPPTHNAVPNRIFFGRNGYTQQPPLNQQPTHFAPSQPPQQQVPPGANQQPNSGAFASPASPTRPPQKANYTPLNPADVKVRTNEQKNEAKAQKEFLKDHLGLNPKEAELLSASMDTKTGTLNVPDSQFGRAEMRETLTQLKKKMHQFHTAVKQDENGIKSQVDPKVLNSNLEEATNVANVAKHTLQKLAKDNLTFPDVNIERDKLLETLLTGGGLSRTDVPPERYEAIRANLVDIHKQVAPLLDERHPQHTEQLKAQLNALSPTERKALENVKDGIDRKNSPENKDGFFSNFRTMEDNRTKGLLRQVQSGQLTLDLKTDSKTDPEMKHSLARVMNESGPAARENNANKASLRDIHKADGDLYAMKQKYAQHTQDSARYQAEGRQLPLELTPQGLKNLDTDIKNKEHENKIRLTALRNKMGNEFQNATKEQIHQFLESNVKGTSNFHSLAIDATLHACISSGETTIPFSFSVGDRETLENLHQSYQSRLNSQEGQYNKAVQFVSQYPTAPSAQKAFQDIDKRNELKQKMDVLKNTLDQARREN